MSQTVDSLVVTDAEKQPLSVQPVLLGLHHFRLLDKEWHDCAVCGDRLTFDAVQMKCCSTLFHRKCEQNHISTTYSRTEQDAASKYRCIWYRSWTEDAKLDLLHYLVGSVLSWNQELRKNLPWVLVDVAMLPKDEGRKLLFEMAARVAFAEEEDSQASERLCRSHAYQVCMDGKDCQPLLHVVRGGKVALEAFFAWVTTKRIEDYKVGDDIYALENRWTPQGETFEPDIPARMRSIEEEDIVRKVRQDHDEQVKNDGADRELVVMRKGDSPDSGRAHVGTRTGRSQSWSDFCEETGAVLAEMIAVDGN